MQLIGDHMFTYRHLEFTFSPTYPRKVTCMSGTQLKIPFTTIEEVYALAYHNLAIMPVS